MRRIVSFIRDEHNPRKWFINVIGCSTVKNYKWVFTQKSGVDKAIDILMNDYTLNAYKVKEHSYDTEWYNIYVEFDGDADEAVFILLASSGGITFDDEDKLFR